MKARALKKRLETRAVVHISGGKICFGSVWAPNLVTYEIDTREIRHPLGLDPEWSALVDKLKLLADSKEIDDYVNGEDELEVRLPVYSCSNGMIHDHFTDEYGWPNVTSYGVLMYDNTFFKTRAEAKLHGLREVRAGIKLAMRSAEDKWKEIAETMREIKDYQNELMQLLEEPT